MVIRATNARRRIALQGGADSVVNHSYPDHSAFSKHFIAAVTHRLSSDLETIGLNDEFIREMVKLSDVLLPEQKATLHRKFQSDCVSAQEEHNVWLGKEIDKLQAGLGYIDRCKVDPIW